MDGYITGKNKDISPFILQGKGVDKYQSDITKFKTVIMGRRTYEFGFQFGLEPGQPAYPNMTHYIFSNSLKISKLSEFVKIVKPTIEMVHYIRQHAETDIYLCGGGQLAGWLLEHGQIDQLKLKMNPVVLGEGTRLFGPSSTPQHWKLTTTESFSDGLQILTYDKV